MRYSPLAGLVFLYCSFAGADWTGVNVSLGETSSDWKFANDTRDARVARVVLQIEEKSETELRVGVSLGHMSLRVAADTPVNTNKFDAQYIGVYLRQPIRLSEMFSLHGLFSYQYNSGRDNNLPDAVEIDWSEAQFELGLSAMFANIRVMPFAVYSHVDGDISDDNGTQIFELEESVSSGIRFDIFVEKTAFVRLAFQSGANAGGFLSFARQY